MQGLQQQQAATAAAHAAAAQQAATAACDVQLEQWEQELGLVGPIAEEGAGSSGCDVQFQNLRFRAFLGEENGIAQQADLHQLLD